MYGNQPRTAHTEKHRRRAGRNRATTTCHVWRPAPGRGKRRVINLRRNGSEPCLVKQGCGAAAAAKAPPRSTTGATAHAQTHGDAGGSWAGDDDADAQCWWPTTPRLGRRSGRPQSFTPVACALLPTKRTIWLEAPRSVLNEKTWRAKLTAAKKVGAKRRTANGLVSAWGWQTS